MSTREDMANEEFEQLLDNFEEETKTADEFTMKTMDLESDTDALDDVSFANQDYEKVLESFKVEIKVKEEIETETTDHKSEPEEDPLKNSDKNIAIDMKKEDIQYFQIENAPDELNSYSTESSFIHSSSNIELSGITYQLISNLKSKWPSLKGKAEETISRIKNPVPKY